MILVGNQRGNYVDAARHFLNTEDNEQVIVHQIRGFLGHDLYSAFQESYACSLGTEAKQHLYSLSLSPPKDADVSEEQFEETIDRAEKRLGLSGQPRAIVFHHKRGRDGETRVHAHAIWCRIDAMRGKAIQMSYDRTILFGYSRELFLENGWELPRGYTNKKDRSPVNYSHAEHQQARRRGKYADDIKRVFQDAWSHSDTKEAFAHALKEQGYIVAKGDRRGFVAVDHFGEVYSIPRALGIKTKEVRDRLGELEDFPGVDRAAEIAATVQPRQPPQQERDRPQTTCPVAGRLKRDPEHLLSIITQRESTFTRHDIARALSSYIDDPETYQTTYQRILTSGNLVQLSPDADNLRVKARYSTREMVELEQKLMDDANALANASSSHVSKRNVENAIRNAEGDLNRHAGVSLSAEQKAVIRHITDDKQLSCVVGAAGAGKSTILGAAREAWEADGRRVFGAALAGKAAKGLAQSSGIESRTLASFELSWQNERNQLQKGDVLVIDEAAMVGSRQMARFISEAKDKGAKLVLVGDAEQLQAIEAGSPFKAITEKIQPATLHEVHRQKEDWQKQASKDFALGRTQEALKTYKDNDRIDVSETRDDAIAALAGDYLNDLWSAREDSSQLALAHRKADVKAINRAIREGRKSAGELDGGQRYTTTHGRREFAAGDRILFTRNDRGTLLKNGMLGTVVKAEKDALTFELDDKTDGRADRRTISIHDYADIDHGYATTIHKSQGATVDNSYVLASTSMDRHLAYVSMTRHKQNAILYTNEEEFPDYERLNRALSRKRQKLSTLDVVNTKSKVERENNPQRREGMVKEAEAQKQAAAEQTQQQEQQFNQERQDKEAQLQAQKQAIMDRLKQDRERGPERDR